MYIKMKELVSLQEAINFISANADGADDFETYEKMQDNLTSIWKKGIKELVHRRTHNKNKKNKQVN